MRKIMLVVAVIAVTLMALSSGAAIAGDKNQNDEKGRGTQGTDKVNGKDGCRPDVMSGNYWVYMPDPPPWAPHEWEGGPCCPSNELATDYGSELPLPNQCCNPPDYVHPQPGNHCECFHLRGYPPPPPAP
jgi:hypothetical protein